jgi:hypothetical protein
MIFTRDKIREVQQASPQVIEVFREVSQNFSYARQDLLTLEALLTLSTQSHNSTLIPANGSATITFTHTLGRVPLAAPRCNNASISVHLDSVSTTQIVVRARNHSGGDITPTVQVEYR